MTDAVGAAVSIVKLLTNNRLLGFEELSVTCILQLVCIPVPRALNVTVLSPEIAHVVTLEQSQE